MKCLRIIEIGPHNKHRNINRKHGSMTISGILTSANHWFPTRNFER